MRITIRSKTYDIRREEVEEKLRAVEPEEEKRAKYFVEIGGKKLFHQASTKPNLKPC